MAPGPKIEAESRERMWVDFLGSGRSLEHSPSEANAFWA